MCWCAVRSATHVQSLPYNFDMSSNKPLRVSSLSVGPSLIVGYPRTTRVLQVTNKRKHDTPQTICKTTTRKQQKTVKSNPIKGLSVKRISTLIQYLQERKEGGIDR